MQIKQKFFHPKVNVEWPHSTVVNGGAWVPFLGKPWCFFKTNLKLSKTFKTSKCHSRITKLKAILPSLSCVSGVTPGTIFSIRIPAEILSQILCWAICRVIKVRVRWLRRPVLTGPSRDGGPLFPLESLSVAADGLWANDIGNHPRGNYTISSLVNAFCKSCCKIT